jgi:hypothetical protein
MRTSAQGDTTVTDAHKAEKPDRAVDPPSADDFAAEVRGLIGDLLSLIREKAAEASLRDVINAVDTLVKIEQALGGNQGDEVRTHVSNARAKLAQLLAEYDARMGEAADSPEGER